MYLSLNAFYKVKIKIKIMLFTILIILTFAILLFGCHKGGEDWLAVNENIIKIKDFSVSSDSTELKTSTKGTIFIKGTEGIIEHIQIVAQIDIDPDDWGGVAFYVSKNWNISDVSSSYPEKKDQMTPEEYVLICHIDEDKWREGVLIGRDRNHIPMGGGTGTVVIDLVPEKEVKQSDKLVITIAVGSDDRNGKSTIETDGISIEIP